MGDAIFLIEYLLIGGAIAWVLKFRVLTPLRRIWDQKANSRIANLEHAARFAGIGDAAPYLQAGREARHEATWGVRILGTLLVTALMFAICPLWGNPSGFLSSGIEGLLAYMTLVLPAVWYMAYLWTYEIVVTDRVISVPTYLLRRMDHDITRLDMIEDDGAYGWRLYFWDGTRVEVLKYVAGRKVLKRRLDRQVELNRRR